MRTGLTATHKKCRLLLTQILQIRFCTLIGPDSVLAFLQGIGQEELLSVFEEQEVDFDTLITLTREDLKVLPGLPPAALDMIHQEILSYRASRPKPLAGAAAASNASGGSSKSFWAAFS